MCREGARRRGEGHSSKPKWLCSCRSLNLPLCTAQGEMRHSPGLAPVMWRGIREMNVFRISNNQRIISTPSVFKSMDPSRLKRHFDWESKSSLPLDTKDNEVAAFLLLSFLPSQPRMRWLSAPSRLSKSVISRANGIQFIVFFLFSQTYEQINHMSISSKSLDVYDFSLSQSASASAVAPSPGLLVGNGLWHNYGMSVNM